MDLWQWQWFVNAWPQYPNSEPWFKLVSSDMVHTDYFVCCLLDLHSNSSIFPQMNSQQIKLHINVLSKAGWAAAATPPPLFALKKLYGSHLSSTGKTHMLIKPVNIYARTPATFTGTEHSMTAQWIATGVPYTSHTGGWPEPIIFRSHQ